MNKVTLTLTLDQANAIKKLLIDKIEYSHDVSINERCFLIRIRDDITYDMQQSKINNEAIQL